MQMEELRRAVKEACQKLFSADIVPEITRPPEQFGDYTTNAALQLAKKAAASPKQIAQQLVDDLGILPGLAAVTIAGPGFINFKLTDEALAKAAFSATSLPKPYSGQEILVEFGDPNPFKEMHIGHLYSYIIGEGIARLLESSGANLKRLSYHGDVGLHVAKAIWGMQTGESDIGKAYALGAKAYEEDEQAKGDIESINEHIYKGDDPQVNQLSEKGKAASFDQFTKILNLLSISNDKRYLESQSAQKGSELVKQNTGTVFKESQGAIVYDGEKFGLHTRVFITSRGLPTYESKDLGLAELKAQDYPNAVQSLIITAHEQADYFKVMLAALAEIDKPTADKTRHLPHGFVSLKSGKMSSRTGEVYAATKLLDEVKGAVQIQYPDSRNSDEVYLAAVKYAFLKHRLGSDIIFDVQESISLEGNSGPYLQYAHARAASILSKAQGTEIAELKVERLDEAERSLSRKVSEYPEVVSKAVNELMPHHVSTYLYELAQVFNSFYEKSRIIGDERQDLRLQLTQAYQKVLQNGLQLLNISASEKM